MKNNDIAENVLQLGKEGVKQNIMESLNEFCDMYADEMWKAGEEVIRLRAENAALREENEALIREADENAALAMQHKMRADDLAKENAELKARLEKAVELPCRIGDTLYGVYNDKVAEYIVIGLNVLADWTLEIYLKTQNKNKRQNRFSTFSTSIGIRYFKDREAAEARLAELKGGKE